MLHTITVPLRASALLGRPVRDPSGRTLGEVSDLVFNKDSTQVLCAVLKFEGILGGTNFHPVPLALLADDFNGHWLVANVCKEQLQAVPSHSVEEIVDSGRQPRIADASGLSRSIP